MLGRAECGECGGTKTLEVRPDGMITSKCLRCGFIENEWLYGDNPDYLNYLAEHYGVTVEQIKKALSVRNLLPTDYQRTIVAQLNALNPYFHGLYGVKAVVAMEDGRTIRLHTRHKGGVLINVDITYDRGLDAYNIKAYRLKNHGLECEEVFNESGFYFDQLDETIHRILHKNAGVPYRVIEE